MRVRLLPSPGRLFSLAAPDGGTPNDAWPARQSSWPPRGFVRCLPERQMTAAPAPANRYFGPTVTFVAPFLIYAGMILLPLSPDVLFPVRYVIVLAVLVFASRP